MNKDYYVTRVLVILCALTATSSLALKSNIQSREVEVRHLPVPTTVSPEEQAEIAAPVPPKWREIPKSASAWKAKASIVSATWLAKLPDLRKQLGVNIQPATIGGVKVFILTPKIIAAENKNRLIVNVHGGAFLYGARESGTGEATIVGGLLPV